MLLVGSSAFLADCLIAAVCQCIYLQISKEGRTKTMYVGIPIFRGPFFKCRVKIYGNQFFEIGSMYRFLKLNGRR